MQRNGTSSVGSFLNDHGYSVAGWNDSNYYQWSYYWSIGDYETIFKSKAFRSFQAYEDAPWFMPDFYKVLYHRFPKSKFILFHRDKDKWFDSMLNLSNGKTIGNTYRHCKIYRRLTEFYDRVDNDPSFNPTENELDNLMSMRGERDHYIKVYEEYNREVIEFFNKFCPDKLFVTRLENSDKWQELGRFLNIDVGSDYDVHSNKS